MFSVCYARKISRFARNDKLLRLFTSLSLLDTITIKRKAGGTYPSNIRHTQVACQMGESCFKNRIDLNNPCNSLAIITMLSREAKD